METLLIGMINLNLKTSVNEENKFCLSANRFALGVV